jgi:hypothetical protein
MRYGNAEQCAVMAGIFNTDGASTKPHLDLSHKWKIRSNPRKGGWKRHDLPKGVKKFKTQKWKGRGLIQGTIICCTL